MRKSWFITAFLFLCISPLLAQSANLQKGNWRAWLQRGDGQQIVFNFNLQWQNGQPSLYISNAPEKLQTRDLRIAGDSIWFSMPVFESAFRARIVSADSLQGEWTRGTVGKNISLPFYASAAQPARFIPVKGKATASVTGKWSVRFTNPRSNEVEPAIAVFNQTGNRLTGSMLTPTGDYRYLEGLVTGDSLLLSTFDGIHAFLITARLADAQHITNGHLYSGAAGRQEWTAFRNDTASLPDIAAMYLKNKDEDKPDFRFKDLDGKEVSLSDPRFKNKVVVIQLMGSWCPNCMDETAFLSEWYRNNHQRGVEVVALAYEYSTDFQRSEKSLRRFQQRFNVTYPMLITGVSVADTLRTEKTLPLFTPIKTFPTSIVLDKSGRVRKIDTGFAGPGTGVYYTRYKKEFEETIDALLKEQKEITKS